MISRHAGKPLIRLLSFGLLLSSGLVSPVQAAPQKTWILADRVFLLTTGIPVLEFDSSSGVGLAEVSFFEETRLQLAAHAHGKCGGYERLTIQPWLSAFEAREFGRRSLRQLAHANELLSQQSLSRYPRVTKKPEIQALLDSVSEARLRETVLWMSSFHDRYYRSRTPNLAVNELKSRIESIVAKGSLAATANLIPHQGTSQQSIRVRIAGRKQPEKTVILGAHLDSINRSWSETRAPGADDNASGSANLIEALQLILTQPQPDRSIEFFWYAGEEGGLIGSSEIAQAYASTHREVIGVLQLDMTLYPGDGEFVLGSMTDFTSPALRQWLGELNQTYLGAKIIDDQCGYACSDHASWHRQGFPAIMPFESTGDRMFPDLHTVNDVIDHRSNFKHSALFSKLAIAFALELAATAEMRQSP
ncbi:MAG: hypothetical protein RJB38_1027 [Pseudomonadota bacterium]|jgi:leucyl aminopeptidase